VSANNSKRDQLAKTWNLMAKHVLAILDSDETPSASMLEVCRKWLEAQGVTADTVRAWQQHPLGHIGPLPTFTDDPADDYGTAPEADPLKVIVPFSKP